jgi:NAD(P)-dependent dehydrogenase (short-subunit alcohol dehydrogenase family)
MAGRLADKVAIVTGAGGGIGSATACKLASEGAAVLCVDIDSTAAARIADELEQVRHRAASFTTDLATADGNRAMVAEAVRRWGGLDILHANAAIQVMGFARRHER